MVPVAQFQVVRTSIPSAETTRGISFSVSFRDEYKRTLLVMDGGVYPMWQVVCKSL